MRMDTFGPSGSRRSSPTVLADPGVVTSPVRGLPPQRGVPRAVLVSVGAGNLRLVVRPDATGVRAAEPAATRGTGAGRGNLRITRRGPRCTCVLHVLVERERSRVAEGSRAAARRGFDRPQRKARPLVIGVVLGAEGLSRMVAAPLMGRLSDRFAREQVLLVSQAAWLTERHLVTQLVTPDGTVRCLPSPGLWSSGAGRRRTGASVVRARRDLCRSTR